ncbi:hypothetical protein EDC04DRAFT_2855214 [Pisolithus marmoratus]|nr:hypothetical protein EDC04DRAFT_2855214 [Pisolithus marmoratus]
MTSDLMPESVRMNLDLFGRLCGGNAAERVRLVTTMWDEVQDADLAQGRELPLEARFLKPLINADVQVHHERFENTFESAWRIVGGLAGEKEVVSKREELVNVERKSNETTANKDLYRQLHKLLEQQEKIDQLHKEAKGLNDRVLAKKLEVDQRRLKAELQKTWEELDKTKTPFFRRIALLFVRKPVCEPSV